MPAWYCANRALVYACATGLFYFFFCLAAAANESVKYLFIYLMLILPGITFPVSTSYFSLKAKRIDDGWAFAHGLLSMALYHGAVWLFSGEGRLPFLFMVDGFCGSLLYLVATRALLKLPLPRKHVLGVALLSGVAFIPYEVWGTLGTLGLALLLWTVVSGVLLNRGHREVHAAAGS